MSEYRLKHPDMNRAEIAIMLKWKKIKGTYKHRYFYFIGSKTDKKHWLNMLLLKYKQVKYPKGDNVNYDASYSATIQTQLF